MTKLVINNNFRSPDFPKMKYEKGLKDMLLNYMQSKEPNSAGGFIFDCIKNMITKLDEIGYEDEEYVWSSTDMYYIKKYDAAVSPQFIEHVKNKMN